jgi:hypothetical protein
MTWKYTKILMYDLFIFYRKLIDAVKDEIYGSFTFLVFQCPLCDIQLLAVGGFFRPLFFFRLLTVFVSPPRGAQYDIAVDFFIK